MTMRRILLIASMIVLGVFLLVSFFNPDKDPHDDDNRDICIALIDSEVSLGCQFDNSKIWVNSNESINGLDDDLNGYIDDLYGWNFRDDNEIVLMKIQEIMPRDCYFF